MVEKINAQFRKCTQMRARVVNLTSWAGTSLRVIFRRLRAAALKVNLPKCSFGFKDVPYLGYVITREGIKPDLKKCKESWILGNQTLILKRERS